MNRRKILLSLFIAAVARPSPVLCASSAAERIEVGGATLDFFIDPGEFELGRAALLDWVTRSAGAVSAYFGRFPVPRARVHIIISQGSRVSSGTSFGDHGARCKISVGRNTSLSDLFADWELTHEMVHFGFPSVADRHHWIEEGIATYVEPIARASVGILTAEQVWAKCCGICRKVFRSRAARLSV